MEKDLYARRGPNRPITVLCGPEDRPKIMRGCATILLAGTVAAGTSVYFAVSKVLDWVDSDDNVSAEMASSKEISSGSEVVTDKIESM